MISFSIIVSCIFISLLLVTVGIVCNKTGSSISVAISTLMVKIFHLMLVLFYIYIQGVPGGMCQTSGGCSLC